MTTPIEVAALAVDSLPWDGQHGGVDPGNVEIARAVFESIDREGLADLIEYAQTEWRMESWRQDKPLADHTADAIIAHLTEDQS